MPRKSKSDILRLPNIPEEFIPDFIRGFYDADGGYYMYGDNLLETFVCGISKKLLVDIQEWFTKRDIILHLRKARTNPDFYVLRSKCADTAIKFRELIFNSPSIYLDRKYALYQEAVRRYT